MSGRLWFAALALACGPSPPGGEAGEGASSGAASSTATREPTTGCDDADCDAECSGARPCGEGSECVDGECVALPPQPVPCDVAVTLEEILRVELPGSGPATIAGAADLEGDGVLELFGARDQLWFVRQADLTPVPIAGPLMVGAFATNVGDLDGDGDLDLLPGASQTVLLGDGLGGFVEVPGPDVWLFDGALGDLDGDGRDELVGFLPECPLDSPDEVECSRGYNPSRWTLDGGAWKKDVYPMLLGHEPGNVLVAPMLAGHAPAGVYEMSDGRSITVTDFVGPESHFKIPGVGPSALVAVRRADDDRASLVRVTGARGSRLRAGQHWLEVSYQWELPSQYRKVAVGDFDRDGNDDLVLAGDDLAFLLDRAELPGGSCVVTVAMDERIGDVAVAELDGAGAPELILAVEDGLAGLIGLAVHLAPY